MKPHLRVVSLFLIITLLFMQTEISFAASQTSPPRVEDIIVTNNAGISDTVVVTGLYGNETVKVYNAASGGRMMGSASATSSKSEVTLRIAQLGKTAGYIFVSLTAKGETESARVKVAYEAEVQSEALSADSIVVTNNAGKADVVSVTGLYGGETLKIYNGATGGKLLATYSVPATKTEANISITQLGVAGGSIYVTVTIKGELESQRVRVDFTPEPKSDGINEGDVTIFNNAGISDTIRVNYLSIGDVVKVYDAAKGGNLLGTATVAYGKTEVTLSIQQLGKYAGSVYLSVTTKGKLESDRLKVTYPAENYSNTLISSQVAITNNSGISDTITVTNLLAGDEIRAYDAPEGGNIIASGTVSTGQTQLSITVPQLGAGRGSLYLSRTTKGKFESTRVKADFTDEPTSDMINIENITITNNAGKADTIVVSGLSAGDTVRVYSEASGGKPLSTATVSASSNQATMTVQQLGTSAGSVYITITSTGKMESNRIKVDYAPETVSDGLLPENVTIINNPVGRADTLQVTSLMSGDTVKVYNAMSGGVLLGSGTVPANATELTLSINQLGTSAGSVYISVTNANKNESSRIKVDYSAETKSDGTTQGNIIVTNNVTGTADTILVTGVTGGDVIKVYDASTGGKILGSATVPAETSYITLSVQQLGVGSGSVYVTITSPNKLESDRIKADYSSEAVTPAITSSAVTINNHSGAPDTLEITGLTEGDTVRVYDSLYGGKILGTATVGSYGTYATVSVPQLGTTAGSVYITVTSVNKLESERTKVDYSGESQSEVVNPGNIIITNNAGASDTLQVTGLKLQDQIRVYSAERGGTLLGSASVTEGNVATVSIVQLSMEAGSVYISITNTNRMESPRIKIDYEAEAKSEPILAEQTSVSNNVGTSDTVRVSGLSGGDTLKIYDTSMAGNLLGTALVGTYETSVEISVTQLGSTAGSLYITRTSKNKLESVRTKVDYIAEAQSMPPDKSLVTVINNAGLSDTIRVSGLQGGDVVKVYDTARAGTLLGTETVSTYGSSVTLSVTQLGTQGGSIYLTVTHPAKLESDRTKVEFGAEPKSEAPSAQKIIVDNNAGIADTVKVWGLSGEEVINVYDAAAGGTLLGSAIVPVFSDTTTVNITQLGIGQGKVYVSLTKKGYQESSRTEVAYLSEAQSAEMDTRNIIITNNAGAADTIQINCLSGGDVVNVYNAATGGALLGTGTVAAYDNHVTLSITQLGGSGGTVYIAIRSVGKLEGIRVAVPFSAEQKTSQPLSGNISITNYAGIADTIKISFLEANDVVKVYSAATNGTLLGNATEKDGSGEVTLRINQLGASAGKVYITITHPNMLESDRTMVEYQQEATSADLNAGNISVTNNANKPDMVKVTFREPYDLIKVYNSASGGTLLGSAMVAENSTEALVSVDQLGVTAGSVYVSVIGYGKKESGRTRIDYTAEQKSDAPSSGNILIRNNANMTDTVTVTFLNEFDSVKVYDSASGGNLLGSATVTTGGSEVTVKISQLGSGAGKVYVTVTSSGKLESSRIGVDYSAETTSDAPDMSHVMIVNNSGKSDTITVAGLVEGDLVKVYNQPSGGSLLGSATVSSQGSEVTIKVTQLGVSAGNVYISVTSPGAFESSRTKVGFASET